MTLNKVWLTMPDGMVAFSTRRGEHDDNPYSGFNACHYSGDNPVHVDRCRQMLCSDLGIDSSHLIIPRQTHSTNVAIIDRIPAGQEAATDIDALVTTLPRTALAINTADCVPIVMADSDAHVISVTHSGWRGTVSGIAEKTVAAMVKLGAEPNRIHAAMGPCICAGCFEVGHEVAGQFQACGFPPNIILDMKPRPHIDLPTAIRHTLLQAGLNAANISMPPACSRCNPTQYFSARRLGTASGRTLTVAMLTD